MLRGSNEGRKQAMWEIEQRKAYLVRVGFDINKVTNATDEWVVRMTSHLS